jgi:hypothetical protein
MHQAMLLRTAELLDFTLLIDEHVCRGGTNLPAGSA